MRYGSLARGLCFAAAVAVVHALQNSPAHAQTAPSPVDAPAHKSSSPRSSSPRDAQSKAWSVAEEPYIGTGKPQWRYFVEFRARNAASYGHMYVMFGEVNSRHEIIKSEIAGLFPAGDARGCENCSIYYWSIGHLLPVPGEIGASDGDLEEQYVLARFRVWVDATQYKRLSAYIKERRAQKGAWNALFANCVGFGRSVASFLDLKIPPMAAIGLLYPQGMVEAIGKANGLKHDQLPLRDAAASVRSESKTDGGTKVVPAPSAAQKDAAAESAARPAGSSPTP